MVKSVVKNLLKNQVIKKVMAYLSDTYSCKMDTKGRISFPVALRRQLQDIWSDGFQMRRSLYKDRQCVEVFPMREWDSKLESLRQLNTFDKKKEDFIRLQLAGARRLEFDAAERFLIPKELMAFANIKKDIMIVCMLDKIEIWDRDVYNSVIESGFDDYEEWASSIIN